MNDKEKIVQAVYAAIDNVNELLEGEKLEKTLEAELLGDSEKLDSLGLVNLILAVEEKIEDSFGVQITLAMEKSAANEGRFKNVQTLADYVGSLLQEKANK